MTPHPSTIPEPAVTRTTLLRGAAVAWALGGLILLWRAWLAAEELPDSLAWVWGIGVLAGIIKYRFVFGRMAGENCRRIEELSPHKEKICLFAFQSMQSYLLVLLMVGLGITLRHFGLPPPLLIVLYVAIGLGLLLGSTRYFRHTRRAA